MADEQARTTSLGFTLLSKSNALYCLLIGPGFVDFVFPQCSNRGSMALNMSDFNRAETLGTGTGLEFCSHKPNIA